MYTFDGNLKLGPQVYFESDDLQKRSVVGLTGYLGWTEHISTLFEVDSQKIEPKSNRSTTGYYLIQKTGYEVTQGFHLFFLNDYSQRDEKLGSTKSYKFGPGLQWFPRPHWDLQTFWTREQTGTTAEGDYAWLVLHYYL